MSKPILVRIPAQSSRAAFVRIVGFLVLFVLLIRAAVPAGFMLAAAQADAGGVTVVICTAHGVQHVPLETEQREGLPSADDLDCPFAASALPALANDPPELAAEVRYAAVAHKLARVQYSLTPLPGASSPRGPPVSV
ncbi:MAG TPA: hypothetical protein PLW75_01580 [Hyphomicrobium sp.]|nr:hypothetical protein [Hyphomicrobium sp.]